MIIRTHPQDSGRAPSEEAASCPWEVFLASAGNRNRVPAQALDEEGEVGRGRSNCLRRGGEGPNSGVKEQSKPLRWS